VYPVLWGSSMGGRPEKPILGGGALAKELRATRELAGMMSSAGKPTYRELAQKAACAPSVLAAAASGRRCPSWQITKAFVTACGQDPERVRQLWANADRAQRARRPQRRRPASPQLAPVKRLRTHVDAGSPADLRRVRPPDPLAASTPAEYVRLLRALRAWGGRPGLREIRQAALPGERWRHTSSSSLYDALSLKRTKLPPLGLVLAVVRACRAENEAEWRYAWGALSLLEQAATDSPSPPEAGPEPPSLLRPLP
jgi:hypothetical protein